MTLFWDLIRKIRKGRQLYILIGSSSIYKEIRQPENLMTQKNHTNKLQKKLGRIVEDRMNATKKKLHNNVKAIIEFC